MPNDNPQPTTGGPSERRELRLGDGTELLGRWDSTAYESAPYMIRRADGQLIQVSRLLFDLAASLDGTPDLDALAARASTRTGRDLSADNVAHLLATKLLPLGVLVTPRTTAGDADAAPLRRANPLLALRLRRAVIPERIHRRVTTTLAALFWPPLVVAALLVLAGADTWIGVTHHTGVTAGVDGIIAHATRLLILAALTVVAAVIHETGHAAATRAGGATPGVMGAGIYRAGPAACGPIWAGCTSTP
jgi:putative peptide zinc metalloprotease protein